jgi:uncharacterized membrane protein
MVHLMVIGLMVLRNDGASQLLYICIPTVKQSRYIDQSDRFDFANVAVSQSFIRRSIQRETEAHHQQIREAS